ncbi:hypothetical protein B0T24DRAFT_692102 [Lasiosphaeria ovina]|uniref:Uncharacterized protein n=1 Tax=Lasiosphaeria ovina TaxID=92902 RepID=A0AAE0MYQ4_9PEZI|nr:hypothetical protein B0T24DRAFT_692102 [Lasiosphaeria ovina]
MKSLGYPDPTVKLPVIPLLSQSSAQPVAEAQKRPKRSPIFLCMFYEQCELHGLDHRGLGEFKVGAEWRFVPNLLHCFEPFFELAIVDSSEHYDYLQSQFCHEAVVHVEICPTSLFHELVVEQVSVICLLAVAVALRRECKPRLEACEVVLKPPGFLDSEASRLGPRGRWGALARLGNRGRVPPSQGNRPRDRHFVTLVQGLRCFQGGKDMVGDQRAENGGIRDVRQDWAPNFFPKNFRHKAKCPRDHSGTYRDAD